MEISDIEPTSPPPRYELYKNGEKSTIQRHLKKITVMDPSVQAVSEVYTVKGGITPEPIFPAVTYYKNSLGGNVIVFAGRPLAVFNYVEAFSFLCASRKHQLVELMKEYGTLPVYYPDDAEVYIKAGALPDGGIFCGFFNVGLDNLDEVTLVADRMIKKIEVLSPDGNFVNTDFSIDENGKITVDVKAEILNPVILCLH